MNSKINALGLIVEPIYMPSASTRLITELLIIMLVLLTFMGGQIMDVTVTALPITSRPIETTAENLAWQAWLMLPLEQKNQIQSRKVTPKSIFLLPLRGDCPPDHHKVDFKCIPITSGTNAMLIDPNVLGLLVGDTNSTFDYDYENEQEESLATEITEFKDSNDYQGTTKSIRQDEPLKFNIFQNTYPTNYDEVNDDYFSLVPEMQMESINITEENQHNITNNSSSHLENTTEIYNSTLVEIDPTTPQSNVPYNATTLFDGDTVRIINSAMGVENTNTNTNNQNNDEDIVLNITLAEILKKDALIPLHNHSNTEINFLNRNSEASNGDMFVTNLELHDTTTLTSIIEDDLNRYQSKSEISTTTLEVTPNLLDKLSTSQTLAPFQIYVPIVVRSREHLNEGQMKVGNMTKKPKVGGEEIETEIEDSLSQSGALVEEGEGITSTIEPFYVDTTEYDNEFSANNDKKFVKIAPTTSTNLITTLERNWKEFQTTTDVVTTTTKNAIEIDLSAPTIASKGTDSFQQQTLSEIYQIKEWRLINELASDVEVEEEQSDITDHNLYEVTTQLKQYDNLGNIPNHTIPRHMPSSGKNKTRDYNISEHAYSSISATNHTAPRNISSSTENNLWRLRMKVLDNKTVTQNVTDTNLKLPTLPIESTQRDSSKIPMLLETTTTQIPPNETETIEYPIEPLLIKLWSAYKAAFRRRNY